MKGLFPRSAKRLWMAPVLALCGFAPAILAAHAGGGAATRAAEHVTLTNGFDLICDHRQQTGDRMRLYTGAGNSSFVEVAAADVASVEAVTLPVEESLAFAPAGAASLKTSPGASHAELTRAELHELLSRAGSRHNLDVNLLASLVRAESGGHTQAVSRAGALGLMQLMPRTAAELGVEDSLRPEQNVAGGSAYLDSLLTRYHDNLALALAAYNAGPAAVDRWHGVPPYRETRLYVARVIRDFNAAVRNTARTSLPAPAARSNVARADSAEPALAAAP